MYISELVEKLSSIINESGDSQVEIEVGYQCGDCCEDRECYSKASINSITVDQSKNKKMVILSGWEN